MSDSAQTRALASAPASSTRERAVPLAFALSGDTSLVARGPGRRSTIRSAEGVASVVNATSLSLDLGRRMAGVFPRLVTVTHNLPSSVDLRPLLGRSLRVTLVDDGASQSLTICGIGGRVWIVARFGPVHGVVHSVGGTEVRAALSQRADGPLVVGTDRLQWLVNPGCHVRLGGAAAGLVVEHVARVSAEAAGYVVAESVLYASPIRSRHP
jgi:hypothetical protein